MTKWKHVTIEEKEFRVLIQYLTEAHFSAAASSLLYTSAVSPPQQNQHTQINSVSMWVHTTKCSFNSFWRVSTITLLKCNYWLFLEFKFNTSSLTRVSFSQHLQCWTLTLSSIICQLYKSYPHITVTLIGVKIALLNDKKFVENWSLLNYSVNTQHRHFKTF